MDFDESDYSESSSSCSSEEEEEEASTEEEEEEDHSTQHDTLIEKRQLVEQRAQQVTHQIQHIKQENKGSMDALVEKLQSMEFRLKEATDEVESTKEKASQAEKEKNLFKTKAYDLAARLSALKKRLQEKEEETSKLETKNRELDSKVTQLKQEVKSTETHLNKSYNDTLEGLTNHIQEAEKQINELDNENNELRFKMTEAQRVCKYLQDKLAESEKNHASVSSDTQFKLTEAQRVSKFLEGKLNKMVEEKQNIEGRVTELETHVQKLKQEIGMKELVIATQAEKMKQKDAAFADASRQILEVEGKLAASVKVCGFLELTLSRAETALARRGPHPEAIKEINDLKRKLAESNDLINALNDGLSMARVGQQTMTDRVIGLEGEVTALSAELAEKEDEARTYKSKWEIETDKTSELAETISKLKQISEESKKRVGETEAEKQALALQLKNRVGDLESNLKVFSTQVHELSNRILQVESEKKQWQDKAENLQDNLKTYSEQVGELQNRVTKTEAEKKQWESKAQDMEVAMSNLANIEELQMQVSKVEKEKKELESKAEVLEVQLATICDILREHKPDIAEMFDSDSEPTKTEGSTNGGAIAARAGGVGGFAQSLFGNKAVLAVTLAAAVVGIVAGDFSSRPHQQQARSVAFVTNFENDLIAAEIQEHEILPYVESLMAENAVAVEVSEFEIESVEVEQDVVWDLAVEVEAEPDAELAEELMALDHVGRVVQSLKGNKIWGKFKSMGAPNLSEEDILFMM